MDPGAPVICDANILFRFHISHILTFMAVRRLINAKWTKEIQQEWLDNIAEKRPADLAGCKRRCSAMNSALPEAMVTGYDYRISTIAFEDPDDRHVIAAALHVRASGIVTRDTAHFTPESMAPFGLKVVDPDELLVACHDWFPQDCIRTVEEARLSLTVTKPSLDQYLETLESQDLPEFVKRLRG
jgi:predicted nucleic acid-binding protein